MTVKSGLHSEGRTEDLKVWRRHFELTRDSWRVLMCVFGPALHGYFSGNLLFSARQRTLRSYPPRARWRHDPTFFREASTALLLQSGGADWKVKSHPWQRWEVPVVCVPLYQVGITATPSPTAFVMGYQHGVFDMYGIFVIAVCL
jgi:hypothetical protein